jgi:chromosome segregation ATPase
MTVLEQAQTALAAAEKQLQRHEHQNHLLRAQRPAMVDAGDPRGLVTLDRQISDCADSTRFARSNLQQVQQRLAAAESAIAQARGAIGSLVAAAASQQAWADRLHQEAAQWERQRDQKLVELQQARATLAQLLGVGIDEIDEQPATTPAPAVATPLVTRPRQIPTPRMVSELGVIKWYDQAGNQVNYDGSAL